MLREFVEGPSTGLSDVLPVVRQELCDSGRKTTQGKCHPPHIRSRVQARYRCVLSPVVFIFDTCQSWCLSGFSTVKVVTHLLLFPSHPVWKEETLCSLHTRRGEVCSTSLRAEYLRKLFGILQSRFVYSPLSFIQSIICLCKYGFKDTYFTQLALIQYYFILLL